MITIPELNMEDFYSKDQTRRYNFIKDLGNSLKEIGFFKLSDHSIDLDVVKKSYQSMEAFFRLEESQKMLYEVPGLKGQRGFVSFGKEHAKSSLAPDLKEFWHVGRELSIDHPLYNSYYKNLWPKEVHDFKENLCALYEQIDHCSKELLKACALYFEFPETLFSEMVDDGNSILRLIHYPPIKSPVENSIRAAAHEDINLITLLLESSAAGLEVLTSDNQWVPIHSLSGQIVVDTGDMMQNLTNGIFKATTHRVVNPPTISTTRFSLPFFTHPRSEVDLSPLPKCVAQTGGKKLFPNIHAGKYLDQRLTEIGL